MIRYVTERLNIRNLNVSDLDDMYEVYANPKVVRWVDDGQPITVEECQIWYDVTEINYKKYGYGMFVIETKVPAQVIGFIGLVHPKGQQPAEIKYALKPLFWGFGYATEAVLGVIKYATEKKNMDSLMATVANENVASQTVLTKAGMLAERAYQEDCGALTQVYKWNQRCLDVEN